MIAVCGTLTQDLPHSDIFQYKNLNDARGIHLFLKGASRTAKYTDLLIHREYMRSEAENINVVRDRVKFWDTEDELHSILDEMYKNATDIGAINNKAIETRIASLTTMLEDANVKVRELKMQCVGLEQERDNLVKQLNNAISEQGAQQRENENNIDEYEQLSMDYNRLVVENETYASRYKSLAEEYNNLVSEYNGIVEQLTLTQGQLSGVETLRKAYNNLMTEYQTLKSQGVSSAEVERLQRTCDNLQLQLDNSMKNNSMLDNAYKMLEDNKNEVDRQLREARSTIDELQREAAEHATNGVAMVQYQELQLKYQQLIENSQQTENDLRKQINSLSNELYEVRGQKNVLENRIASTRGNVAVSALGKYDMFATSFTSTVNETLTRDEMAKLNGVNLQNISVCLFAGGDSMTQFFTDLSSKMDTFSRKVLLVDLTNDFGVMSFVSKEERRRINNNTIILNPANIRPENLVNVSKMCMGFVSNKFNDIALLTVDWGEFLLKIANIAQGAPVCIMLGSASSFAMKNTFVKLSSVCRGYFFSEGRTLVMLDTLAEVRQMYNVVNFLLVVTKLSQSANKIVDNMTSLTQLRVLQGVIDFEGLKIV